jgi:tripartite-type tricarboxylate transporter receptor subunit TctC
MLRLLRRGKPQERCEKRFVKKIAAALFALAAASMPPAYAQSYPTRTIRFIVPQQAGGQNDIQARLIAQRLGDALGQPVVIDNRPGAGGAVGFELAAQTPPDGHMIALGSISTLAVIPMMPRKPRYDVLKDFAPVTLISRSPYIVVVHPAVPARSIKELVALAKARPGALSYASSGTGTGVHLTTEMFKLTAGIDMVHVPYKGSAPGTIALLSGEAAVMFNNVISAMPHVRTGKLRALAVTGSRRSHAAPQVPTIAESGYRDFEAGSWQGIVARAGTPPEIVERLNREIVKILNTPDVKDAIQRDGNDVVADSPQAFAVFIRTEMDKLGKVIKAAGVTD